MYVRKIFAEFSLRLKREKWYVCNSAVVSRTSCIYARFCLPGVVHEINFDVCMFLKAQAHVWVSGFATGVHDEAFLGWWQKHVCFDNSSLRSF